jgi:predicted Zn-dependent peptidase
MGIIMSGDFNPDEVIAKIDKAFSYMKPNLFRNIKSDRKSNHLSYTKEVVGPNPENVMLGFRFPELPRKMQDFLNLVGICLPTDKPG